MRTFDENKLIQAKAILKVWEDNGLNMPDITLIIKEALEDYIENIQSMLKQAEDYERENSSKVEEA